METALPWPLSQKQVVGPNPKEREKTQRSQRKRKMTAQVTVVKDQAVIGLKLHKYLANMTVTLERET